MLKVDPTSAELNILLANPRGFCAGVDRAISIVERALELFEPPIYVRHEVVHNRYVVQNLKDRGAIFVEELHQVPDNSIVIFSAHGVSQAVRKEAKTRGLKVFDATCPLVTKVHLQVTRASRKGIECILIGHEGHPEVEGTMGQYDNDEGGVYLIESPEDVNALTVKNPDNLCFVTQTTLSVDDTLDIIAALQTLPGTQTVGESGRLFVRGGESDETQTFVDGIRVAQPYGATTQNIPTRGRFSPFLFSGISFSTGGYSAEYSEAL